MSLPNYSIVIPVLSFEENPYLEDLLQNLGRQSHLPKAVHLVIGDRRQGRAINYGVSKVDTPYVGTLDDDSFIDDPELFQKILLYMSEDDSVGMAGSACEVPEWASSFQKKAMLEIPRRVFLRQKEHVDSDMVQHPCLVMPTELFRQIGGEDEELIRGLDPVLRKKVRDAGKRVVVVKDTWVYHLLPDGFKALCRMYYRNGRGSGYAQRFFPERVLELTDGYDGGSFVERRPLAYRLARRCLALLSGLARAEFLKLSTDVSYGLGVLVESMRSTARQEAPPIENIECEAMEGYAFPVLGHRVSLGEIDS